MNNDNKIDFQTASNQLFKGIRSEETRKNLIRIIDTIIKESKNNPHRAVRATDLQKLCVGDDKIQHVAIFYRLLKRLVENKIVYEMPVIQKRSPGRTPKYYAVYNGFSPLILESRESLLDRCLFLENRLKTCEELHKDSEEKFKIACEILKEKGIDNPMEMIEDLLYD